MIWKNVKDELPPPNVELRVRCFENNRVCWGIYIPEDEVRPFQIEGSDEYTFEMYLG